MLFSQPTFSVSMGLGSFEEAFDVLVRDIGLDDALLKETIIQVLIEERIAALTPPGPELRQMIDARDGLARYWHFVEERTHRGWDSDCVRLYWDRVKKDSRSHARVPISLADRMRLYFTAPRVCRECGRAPPDVKLQVDHVEPVARGGHSGFSNLQFLCSECNTRKGAKLGKEQIYGEFLC
jgi:5-methylcytosine-specific restriction endonuclease McrA